MRYSTSFVTILSETIKRHRYFLGWCWYICTCYFSGTVKNFLPFIHSSWPTLARLISEEKSHSSVSKPGVNWHNRIRSLHLHSTPLPLYFCNHFLHEERKHWRSRQVGEGRGPSHDWLASWKSDWLCSNPLPVLKVSSHILPWLCSPPSYIVFALLKHMNLLLWAFTVSFYILTCVCDLSLRLRLYSQIKEPRTALSV